VRSTIPIISLDIHNEIISAMLINTPAISHYNFLWQHHPKCILLKYTKKKQKQKQNKTKQKQKQSKKPKKQTKKKKYTVLAIILIL
jgi:predicted histidine transporter YuiF (NhaC family)